MPTCARCTELEAALARSMVDRQHLLEQLAQERARANALFVAFPQQGPGEARVHVAPLPAPGEPPLRYQLVDALNGALKKALPGAHRLVRSRATAAKGK